jgi:rRNA maturation protein Nop10
VRSSGANAADERQRGGHVSDLQTLLCPTCGEDTEFEQPSCIDGHTEDGGACPEWACTECGTALVIGDVPVSHSEVWHRAA